MPTGGRLSAKRSPRLPAVTALDRDLDDLGGSTRPYEPPLPDEPPAPAPAAAIAPDRDLGWIRRMLPVLLTRKRQLAFGLSAAAVAMLAQIIAPARADGGDRQRARRPNVEPHAVRDRAVACSRSCAAG